MDHQAFAQLLGNYGEFVGAIAVVGTLIYLAIQVKEAKIATNRNSEIALAQNYQSRSEESQKAFRSIADSEHLAPLLARLGSFPVADISTFAGCTPEELQRLGAWYHYLLLAVDNQHYQFQHGFMDEDYYEGVVAPAFKALAPAWDAFGLLTMGRRSEFLAVVQPYRTDSTAVS